jgi:hypothetical protein
MNKNLEHKKSVIPDVSLVTFLEQVQNVGIEESIVQPLNVWVDVFALQ